MTATGGAFLSSCHVKVLPKSNAVPAAWKYSGDMLNVKASAAAFDGFRSVVLSLKTCAPLSPPLTNGAQSIKPTDFTPGMDATASIMRFCISGTASPL